MSRLLPAGFLPRDDAVVLGTVGRLAEVKNQQAIIHALARMYAQSPEKRNSVRLLLVGDVPLREDLQRLVGELELNEVVWMAGDRQDIPELLQAMDLFVLPSLAITCHSCTSPFTRSRGP